MKLTQFFAPAVLATALIAAPAAFAADAPGAHHGAHHGMGHGKDHGKGHDSLHEMLKQVCDLAKHTEAKAVISKCNSLMEGHSAAVKKHTEEAAHHGVHHGAHHGAHHGVHHGADGKGPHSAAMPDDETHKKPNDHHHTGSAPMPSHP